MMPAVSGNDLIAAVLSRTDDGGKQNAVAFDAGDSLLHQVIVVYRKGVSAQREQLVQWDFYDCLACLRGLGFVGVFLLSGVKFRAQTYHLRA